MARHHRIGVARNPRVPAGALLALAALLIPPAPARGASTTILITEVEADPTPIGSDTPGEWFELQNIADQALVLANWTVTDDQSTDVLPAITLAPGECIVVATDTTIFRTDHPGYAGRLVTVGSIGTGLATAGDRVVLRDGSGADVDCVSWGTNTSCFTPAAGVPTANTVATLQRGSLVDTDAGTDWTSANRTPCPGAVGVADPPSAVGGPTLAITPNPCFGSARISRSGVEGGPWSVAIHDATGRRVRTLRSPGPGPAESISWDGLDELGRAVPAGVYLVRMQPRSGAARAARLLVLR
jgi:hypothetical protein